MGNYKDNLFFGTVKVGERGQIVIPKEAREKFDIHKQEVLKTSSEEDLELSQVEIEKTYLNKKNNFD
jgi:AbrB family looped-hinge helix DNA binding protein